jgi:hypothetical protein
MGINILVAILAGYLLPRQGWKRGLIQAMGFWLVVSMAVVIITTYS